jgi:hypothetical protein
MWSLDYGYLGFFGKIIPKEKMEKKAQDQNFNSNM